MSDTIIKVENLSKRYRIGLREEKAKTFAEQMVRTLKYPIQNFRQIRNLGKFGQEEEGVHWALKDVSFEVKQGEVLGIIGKNGAGKSTLLKILSKITEPTSGRIELHGRLAALLEVGTGFHPELTGRENIYMNGTILGMTKKEIDSKLDEIIDFSGVEKYVDTPVKFYSSGMRVRLGFSVAAHLDPEILIVDEVLAVGDFEFQKKCLGKMEDVSKNQGRTVLFVSHNMGAIQNLCNNVIILKDGLNNFKYDSYSGVKKYISDLNEFENSFSSKYIESIKIFDESNKETQYIKSNTKFKVKIRFKDFFDIETMHVGFFIVDREGSKIGATSTNFKEVSNSYFKRKPKEVEFLIKNLKLIGDEYFLNISLVRKGKGRLDFIENAKKIIFLNNDIYQNEISLTNHFGKIYIDFQYNYF